MLYNIISEWENVIRFSLDKLLKLSKGNSNNIIKNLQEYYTAKKNKTFIKHNLSGSEWIINPEPLFYRQEVDVGFRVQYILLAARRDFYLYRTYGNKSLLLSYFPDLEMEKIKHNPLLTITETEIKFKYE